MAVSNFQIILIILLSMNAIVLVFFAYIDYFKKRKILDYPFISFIMPTYNDNSSIEKSLESVYKNYPLSKFEIFVINDCSKDNTLQILKEMNKKYDFILINNEKNLGKAASVNKVFPKTKGEFVFIIDSDIVLNKGAVDDILARIQSNNQIACVGARYESVDKNFLTSFQNLEYNLISLFYASQNIFSSLGMNGGCSIIRRKAFEEVGMLSTNMIIDDFDLALKLNKKGYKVEQSLYPVESSSMTTLSSLYKQQLRWSSGGVQCFIKHFKTIIKNPVFDIFFIIGFLSITTFFLTYIVNVVILRFPFNFIIFYTEKFSLYNILFGIIVFPLFSVPYLIWGIKRLKRTYLDFLLIYPFSLIYLPFLTVVGIHGFFLGIFKYFALKEEVG